jgi:hypothetical protein
MQTMDALRMYTVALGFFKRITQKKYADPRCLTISRQCTVHLREEGGGATYDELSPRLRDLLLGERTV